MNAPAPSDLAPLLLSWYDEAGRTLPWRGIDDLYKILVSELMLQQTRVHTVLGYFDRFLDRFPDVETLASASEEEVMAAWSGLGFYRRARNLHQAAQLIVSDHQGLVPEDPVVLQTLPGIGRYTAGAILSSGRNAKLPILDGNVIRVLARVYSIDAPPDRAATLKTLWKLAEDILPDDRPGDFNQAIMDLGATVCRHPSPHCSLCPFQPLCTSSANGTSEEFPLPGRATRVKHMERVALLRLGEDGRFALQRRPAKGLLAGLWELPSADRIEHMSPEEQAQALSPGGSVQFCGTVEHRFSHRHWTIQVFAGLEATSNLSQNQSEESCRVSRDGLDELGVPRVSLKTIDCALKKLGVPAP